MPINSKTTLNYLMTMTDAIPNVTKVYKGVPESISAGVVAYIALLGQSVPERVQGVIRRRARYMITFAYRVSGAEEIAEDKLAENVDDLISAFFADRTLGGTCNNSEIDLSIPDAPDYRALAGQEYRMFPVVITGIQDANLAA